VVTGTLVALVCTRITPVVLPLSRRDCGIAATAVRFRRRAQRSGRFEAKLRPRDKSTRHYDVRMPYSSGTMRIGEVT
jgi:hypothetical protein